MFLQKRTKNGTGFLKSLRSRSPSDRSSPGICLYNRPKENESPASRGLRIIPEKPSAFFLQNNRQKNVFDPVLPFSKNLVGFNRTVLFKLLLFQQCKLVCRKNGMLGFEQRWKVLLAPELDKEGLGFGTQPYVRPHLLHRHARNPRNFFEQFRFLEIVLKQFQRILFRIVKH